MKLNFLVSIFYRLLLLLAEKPNYLSTAFDNTTENLIFQNDPQLPQSASNSSLDIEIKFIDTKDDNNSCLYDSNILPHIQALFEYNSLLNAYNDLNCDTRENSTNLLFTDVPDSLMEDIEQLKINKTCVYRPLSQTMLSENLLSYAVNNTSDIQFYLQQDLLALRSAYLFNYYQTCKTGEGKLAVNRTLLLPPNKSTFPDCNSLPIVKEHLEIASSQMLSYSIERSNSSLLLPHPLYIVTLQDIDQLPYQLGKQPILQCRIENIDYIVRGRLGMKFLLHELSTRTIDGWFKKPLAMDTNCTIFSISYSNSSPSIGSTTPFANITNQLKKIEIEMTSDEISHRNCGNINYKLFKLGLDFEEKIPQDTIITLCCYSAHSRNCSKLPSNYRFLVTKFVDIYRKNYLSRCGLAVEKATRKLAGQVTDAGRTSRVSRTANKRIQKLHKCEKHSFVTRSVRETKEKITQDTKEDMDRLETMPNNTDLCLKFRKDMHSYIYRQEMRFDLDVSEHSKKSHRKCFFGGNYRTVNDNTLRVVYHKKIREWVKRRIQICTVQQDPTISFIHSRDEGKICVKLGLYYLKDHFTLIAKRMLDSDHSGAFSEELDTINPSLIEIPLDIFFSHLTETDIEELEKDIAGPAFILQSDNRVKKACVNYLLGLLYYKKADNLKRMIQQKKIVNYQQTQLVIDYANKSIHRFNNHTELLSDLGKFSEYELRLYLLQRDMYKKLGNKEEESRYRLLADHFSEEGKVCKYRLPRNIATSYFSDLKNETILDASYRMDDAITCSNMTLEEYTYKLSLRDTLQNIAFKDSIFFAESCNLKKALEKLESAYEEEGPRFSKQFSKTCPYISSINATSFFKNKLSEEMNSEECINKLDM